MSLNPCRRLAAALSMLLASTVPVLAAQAAATTAAQAAPAAAAASAALKVLRVPFAIAETTFDPAKINDLYSRTITPHIFEALYEYDHLARPARIKPLTAVAMPEVSSDFKTWTVRVKPGIYFASDPAFKGAQRELVAQDYAYSYRRIVDPANKSPQSSSLLDVGFIGLRGLHDDAINSKTAFDYARPIDGIKVLDRYTIQFNLESPRPRVLETLAQSDVMGAMANEVVEFYGDKIGEHPVGTGPFKLVQWRRSSFIALDRNPDYRERRYDAEPGPDDKAGQAILAKLKGRRLPLVDRVEVSVISEEQPRWLAFLNGQIDGLLAIAGSVPTGFVNLAMPNGKVAPNLAKRGIVGKRDVNSDTGLTYFNMEDAVIGGYTADKVALRRALSLALDVGREIQLVRRGQAIPAQSPVVPHTSGYDPAFKSEMSDYDPPRAKALLDLYGYTDKDGDGWRDQPDGKPLVLEVATQPTQINRQFNELWKRNLEAVGLRVKFNAAQWPEQLKAARAGKLQVWLLGSSADRPDGVSSLERLYGPASGGQNLSRFKLPAFDAIYDQLQRLPDGPERDRLFLEAKKIAAVYLPYKNHVHRISTDLYHPWLIGYRRPQFWQEWWHRVDIDTELRDRARR